MKNKNKQQIALNDANKEKLKEKAKEMGISQNAYINYLLNKEK